LYAHGYVPFRAGKKYHGPTDLCIGVSRSRSLVLYFWLTDWQLRFVFYVLYIFTKRQYQEVVVVGICHQTKCWNSATIHQAWKMTLWTACIMFFLLLSFCKQPVVSIQFNPNVEARGIRSLDVPRLDEFRNNNIQGTAGGDNVVADDWLHAA
jgi:hypothetical protein